MRRAFAALTATLPQGWGDLGRQIGLLLVVDLAYETVRGLADGQHAVPSPTASRSSTSSARTDTFFEPGMQAFFLPGASG